MNEIELKKLKIAIVYDRVNKFGGAERVLLTLHEMFPDAPLYTSVYDNENAKWANVFPKIYTSFLQKFKFARTRHQFFGWLMPLVFESFDFKDYDLVISVTSEAAKGIITLPKTFHLCYMLTPTRYLWSGYDEYFKKPFLKFLSWPVVNYLKWWDKVAANRPDKIIAISTEVQNRIKKYYDLDSEIIFPPVSLHHKNSFLRVSAEQKTSRSFLLDARNYYYIHGRFEPYKRLDLVIETFKDLDLPLIVSGSGSEFEKFRNLKYDNIKFIYKPTDDELIELYSNSKAFLMPQIEDFGITSVEAQSLGVPVIAFSKGGSLDTVVDGLPAQAGKTGILFNEQTKESLTNAIQKFDRTKFDSRYLITNAKRFSQSIFKENFINFIKNYKYLKK